VAAEELLPPRRRRLVGRDVDTSSSSSCCCFSRSCSIETTVESDMRFPLEKLYESSTNRTIRFIALHFDRTCPTTMSCCCLMGCRHNPSSKCNDGGPRKIEDDDDNEHGVATTVFPVTVETLVDVDMIDVVRRYHCWVVTVLFSFLSVIFLLSSTTTAFLLESILVRYW
jgi:hypothetical protein